MRHVFIWSWRHLWTMTPSLSIADKLICVHTIYRIVFSRARESYRMGYQFTHKNGDFGAISVQRREAVPRRSLKWRVTYRIRCSNYTGWLFVSSPKLIWYSMIIALLFWFRFTDSWCAKEIKTSSTLIYLTLKKDVYLARPILLRWTNLCFNTLIGILLKQCTLY